MLRKLIFCALMVLSLAAPTAVVSQARAGDKLPSHALHARYEVMYRRDHQHSWRLYGTYESRHQAQHAADHLRGHGYEVHIDVR